MQVPTAFGKADLQIYKATSRTEHPRINTVATKSYGVIPAVVMTFTGLAMEAMALIEIDGLPMFTY